MEKQMNHFTLFLKLAGVVLLGLCVSCTPIERQLKPSMTVTSGPERVFDQPLSEILPELENAIPTGNNGRVGNELVFWSYQLEDNRQVNFYGCAVLDDVDCERRIRAICPTGGEDINRAVVPGDVRHLHCRSIGIVGVGDLLPNCDDHTQVSDLIVGLLQCN